MPNHKDASLTSDGRDENAKQVIDAKMADRIVALIGAAALAAAGSASVAEAAPGPAPTLQVQSFAELLQPIPNARAVLAELDAQRPRRVAGQQVAQYYEGGGYYHHHHHHHHAYPPPYWQYQYRHRRHHHHHHHHHQYW